MGERATIDQDYLYGAADAIRRKNGTSTTYKPAQFEAAIDAIPTGITPTGTINIMENGDVDVTDYATAHVAVSGGGGGATILSGTSEPSSSQGSNGNLYMKYYDGSDLPSGYKGVDYITFAGTQYFNTGISSNTSNLRVVAEMAVTSIGIEAFWGGAWSESGYFLMAYGGKFRWHSGGKAVDAATITANQWYEIETNKSGVIIDGTTYALTSPSGSDTVDNLTIGNVTSGGQGAAASMKLKRTKIYSGTTLLADYIPALDSSNVPCFYDVIGETTKYSAGTAFSAGSACSDGEILAAYVKSSGAWQKLIGSNISDVGGVTA